MAWRRRWYRAILCRMWPGLTDEATAFGDEVATFADLLLLGAATGLAEDAMALTRQGLAGLEHADLEISDELVHEEAVAFRPREGSRAGRISARGWRLGSSRWATGRTICDARSPLAGSRRPPSAVGHRSGAASTARLSRSTSLVAGGGGASPISRLAFGRRPGWRATTSTSPTSPTSRFATRRRGSLQHSRPWPISARPGASKGSGGSGCESAPSRRPSGVAPRAKRSRPGCSPTRTTGQSFATTSSSYPLGRPRTRPCYVRAKTTSRPQTSPHARFAARAAPLASRLAACCDGLAARRRSARPSPRTGASRREMGRALAA